MDLGVFIKGVIIGFSIAAPVGPIGVLCIRRTLAEGRASGFFVWAGRSYRRYSLRVYRQLWADLRG